MLQLKESQGQARLHWCTWNFMPPKLCFITTITSNLRPDAVSCCLCELRIKQFDVPYLTLEAEELTRVRKLRSNLLTSCSNNDRTCLFCGEVKYNVNFSVSTSLFILYLFLFFNFGNWVIFNMALGAVFAFKVRESKSLSLNIRTVFNETVISENFQA